MSPNRGWISLGAAFLCLLAVGAARADGPPVRYETSIPGYYIPHASSVVVDDAGNAYFIGSAYEDHHSLDVLVAKVDATGDPVWSRYIVSSSHNYATDLALDANGDLWVTGWTDSPDFPLVNPMDATFQAREVFLMRLDGGDGTTEYSTFLGGDYVDEACGIEFNAAGEIILAGTTGSTDYPVTPDAYQGGPSFPLYFFTDTFLTRLSPTGDQILYSTYFGGQEDDAATKLVLDSAGNMILAGTSTATDFPLVNPLQSTPNDIFLAKFSADGSTLMFSTYFGGEDVDRVGGMAIDPADNIYLTGSTRSIQFPTTPGAYQENFVGAINGCEIPFGGAYNCEDVFVTKLAPDVSSIVWSTYLGGSRPDEGRAIAVDPFGRVLMAGYTSSADFPPDGSTAGAEIVVCRLGQDGSVLDYNHSVPSGSANRGNGVAVDHTGAVYFTGTVGVPASVFVSKLEADAPFTGVSIGEGGAATALALGPGVPNPFRPDTRFEYAIPQGAFSTPVRLGVYDVGGHLVRELVNADQAPGRYAVTWHGIDDRGTAVGGGVYFLRLEAAGKAAVRKVVKLD